MPAGSRPHDACVRQRFQSSNRVNVGGEEVCRELEVLGVVGIMQGRLIPVPALTVLMYRDTSGDRLLRRG